MNIQTVTITPFEQNARIITDPESGAALIIDPGGEIKSLLASVPKAPEGAPPYRIEGVVLTHAHIDHAGGVAELVSSLERSQGFRPKLYAHPVEAAMRRTIAQQAIMFGLSPADYQDCPEPDVLVNDGDTISFGPVRLEALFTPGHSPGHLSFFVSFIAGTLDSVSRAGKGPHVGSEVRGPVLLAGDALFAGSIGRTDLPGGNHSQLLTSIREKLLPLPGETVVLSGHGENTTIERERRSNPFLR